MTDLFWHTLFSFISTALTHLVVVFYAKQFEWSDLRPTNLGRKFSQYYFSCPSTCLKALACGSLLGFCRQHDDGWRVSVQTGRLLIVMLALPQLYRLSGRRSQQLRVVLGPLTPILAAHNWLGQPLDAGNLAVATTSWLAFAVLRPDNTAVLDLLLPCRQRHHLLSDAKTRRKLHGILAAGNAAIALLFWCREASDSVVVDEHSPCFFSHDLLRQLFHHPISHKTD